MSSPRAETSDEHAPTVRVGVDTGGTFTDFLIIEGEGEDARASVRKLPSTPDDPSRVIAALVGELPAPPTRLVHGSTVATNALLERKGARLVWITTAGFRDLVEIGRQDRPHLYDPSRHPDPPPVPRARRIEVEERLGPGGEVWTALDRDTLPALVERVRALDPEAIAVGLLHSTEDPVHERAIAAALAPLGVPVVTSSSIAAEPREFERFATALASASVTPAMDRYLDRLAAVLPHDRWAVMESSGGAMPWSRLRESAVRTVLSGPAGGVVAATRCMRGTREGAVAFDMGGTSTDVTLVPAVHEGGHRTIPTTRTFRLGTWPIAVPVVDGHTVGAGGGSLAWVDRGGALRVGPESAGARPGPICYGRGGTTPTVTDAHFLLGRIPADVRLGGEMPLTAEGVDDAFARLGAEVGLSPLALARGILRVVEAEMERALRRITQERGVDPRGLTLISFGGAGGLHAVSLARSLGAHAVLVPPEPGILSAIGMLEAPTIEFGERTVLAPWSADLVPTLGKIFAELETEARARLCISERDSDRVTVHGELAMRIVGQAHDLPIPWSPEGDTDARPAFHAAYRTRFGVDEPHRPVEVTALRVRLEVAPDPIPLPVPPAADDAPLVTTRMFLEEGDAAVDVPRVPRGRVRADEPLAGPALIEERTSTLWLPPGASARRGDEAELRIDPGAR